MYSLQNIINGVRNPRLSALELAWIYHRKIRGRRGMSVMEEDWDNLIILDACRYDLFKEINTIEAEPSEVVSSGSTTGEFLDYNFQENEYLDTVYISANPHTKTHGIDEKFFDYVRLWESNWDSHLQTVLPASVKVKALKKAEQHPNKRYIIHFIQPHYPFIGEVGQDIEQGSMTGGGLLSEERGNLTIWEKLENGLVDRDTVWNAYKENLKTVLPHVEDLIEELGGKSVITSDHGNAFGRFGVYGHPGRKYLKELVRVPWLSIQIGERRTIKANSAVERESTDADIEEKLADLGYM